MSESSRTQTKLIRKYLKVKLLEDNITFRGFNLQRQHVYELMKKTISHGESHSALVIGARGSGKTTLINSVLNQLSKEVDLQRDGVIVRLSGLLHQEDKVALKAITAQMQLENAVGDRVFGTFAENLAFLLSCLASGVDRRCRSMVFILDEFDLFCHSGRTQTLLYNLFDIAHSGQAPVCVVGLTARLDVMELLEKRVKSRFSHRHIQLYPTEAEGDHGGTTPTTAPTAPSEHYLRLLVLLLSMPLSLCKKEPQAKKKKKAETNYEQYSVPAEVLERCGADVAQFAELERSYLESWNERISSLAAEERVMDAVEKFCYYTLNEQIFRDVLFQLVSSLSPSKPYIDGVSVCRTIDKCVSAEHRVALLQSLSVLELSVVIAMKHGLDIFDGQPMNFEMILHRYTKFANSNSSAQTVPRPVILKAFEHLQALEIVMPVRGTDSIYSSAETSTSRVQKEYRRYTLAVPAAELERAVRESRSLPTEILHWLNNELA